MGAAALPSTIGPFATAGERVYGIDQATHEVIDLGTWPNLDGTAVVFDLVAPADQAAPNVYVSGFLDIDPLGETMLAGYTLDYDAQSDSFPGQVAAYAFDDQSVTHVSAPGIWTGAVTPSGIATNSLALDGVGDGGAVYGGTLTGDPAQTLFTFPADFAGSGFLAVSTAGQIGVGYADGEFINRFAIARVMQVAAAQFGSPVAFADLVPVAREVQGAARFADGLALLHASYDDSFALVLDEVALYAFDDALDNTAPPVVTSLLTAQSDGCETVDFITPIGDDLLVRVTHPGGLRRLVRVAGPG